MLSKKLACLLALCGLALSSNAVAVESWLTSTIRAVYPLGDGTFVLMFDTNAADCTNTATYKYHQVSPNQNGVTDEGAKKIYAAALAALAADKTVQVAFDNATSACYINRLIVLK